MIRGTKNEGISSLTKKRHDALGLIGGGVGGESYESGEVIATGAVVEQRDAIDNHVVANSQFPSGDFNGTYE
jgi:hypothetical protein